MADLTLFAQKCVSYPIPELRDIIVNNHIGTYDELITRIHWRLNTLKLMTTDLVGPQKALKSMALDERQKKKYVESRLESFGIEHDKWHHILAFLKDLFPDAERQRIKSQDQQTG